MRCPNCNAQMEEGAIFCGNCGNQIAPMKAHGETARYATQRSTFDDNDLPTVISSESAARDQMVQTPLTRRDAPQSYSSYAPANVPQAVPSDRAKHVDTPLPPSKPPTISPSPKNRRAWLFAILILVIVAAATIGAVALSKNGNNSNASTAGSKTNTTGGKTSTTVSSTSATCTTANESCAFFSDGQHGTGHTDALKLTIHGLPAPATGSQYDAWIFNSSNEHFLPLGTLIAANGAFSLNYPGDSQHTNLLSEGDQLEITQEQRNVSLPTGQPVLTGTFPPKAFVHIKHLLVSFPGTPGNIGLLVGLLRQTQLLNGQALVLNNAVSGQNQAAIQCLAQSMIDIIEGSADSHYQALGANCSSLGITQTGDGYGLLGNNGYVMNSAAHAFLAANQQDTTAIIRLHAGHVQIATTSIQGWLNTVEHDTLDLLSNPNNTSKVPEIVQLSNQAYQGIDTNGDERVDPVPGEAGAVTAYAHGQLMATLPLTPVSQ